MGVVPVVPSESRLPVVSIMPFREGVINDHHGHPSHLPIWSIEAVAPALRRNIL
jgi:hypothetical protein